MKKKLSIALLLVSAFFLASCAKKKYEEVPFPGEFIWKQIILFEGSEYTFDIESINKDHDIEISEYEISVKTEDFIKLENDTITPVDNGNTNVNLKIIDNKNKKHYSIILAKVVSVVESKMIEVRTYEDLKMMGETRSGNYILKSDIDLKGIDFEPIGNLPNKDEFIGMFVNLGGYKIKNLTITSSNNVHHGIYGSANGSLFGDVMYSFLYGLELENVSIDVSDFKGNSSAVAAALSSRFHESISINNHATGNISGQDYTGGLLGSVGGSIVYNNSFEGEVIGVDKSTADYFIGGLIGYSLDSRVENSKFFGEIISDGIIGGVIGCNDGLETYVTNNNHFAALHEGKLLKEAIGRRRISRYYRNWNVEIIIVN